MLLVNQDRAEVGLGAVIGLNRDMPRERDLRCREQRASLGKKPRTQEFAGRVLLAQAERWSRAPLVGSMRGGGFGLVGRWELLFSIGLTISISFSIVPS